jgi:hypothetical protein
LYYAVSRKYVVNVLGGSVPRLIERRKSEGRPCDDINSNEFAIKVVISIMVLLTIDSVFTIITLFLKCIRRLLECVLPHQHKDS